MSELARDMRAMALKKVQDKILLILDNMGKEIDNLVEIDEAKSQAKNLQQFVGEIRDITISFGDRFSEESRPIESFQKIDYNELFEGTAPSIKGVASGGFGEVFLIEFRGQKVAVKMPKRISGTSFESEIHTLRSLSHDNIISFRGWGEHNSSTFFVMEHLEKNLQQYVYEQSSDDNKGLSSRISWEISKQIAQAMLYLHNLKIRIVHADLKPDNILVDTKPIIPKPKLCDFGLSRHDSIEDQIPPKGYIRYRTKISEMEEAKTMDDLLMFDVFAFGLVVLFMRTGTSPYPTEDTEDLEGRGMSSPLIKKDGRYFIRKIKLPSDLPSTELGCLIKKCCGKSAERPTFKKICEEFFAKNRPNPFNLSEKGVFFECGFLKDTQIFVADSMVADTEVSEDKPAGRPPGYRREDLICAVEVKDKPYHDKDKIRDDENLFKAYRKHYQEFVQKAKNKEIDDNPAIALSDLITDRSGHDEAQKVELRYKEKTYCHHRAMREVWRSYEPKYKEGLLPCLSKVEQLYSTSFGLHVAILTNEGAGKAKKFVFTRRSNMPGMASPGSYTCGAVESCSVKDYLKPDEVKELVPNADREKAYVSLLNTAARGLEEELGLPLKDSDKDAITLNTIYLKFDNHEWGMCGFVDLTSDKIREENRFSFQKLNAAFTSGPKDKFEHWQIHGVDFELRAMVEWIREHHDLLASSAKIVVVKVLQAFFGTAAVANEFNKKM